MEIIESYPATPVLFKDISAGTGFKWREWYYMKIEACTVDRTFGTKSANAVGLDSGLLAYFDPTDTVNLALMKVVAEV